jgi:4-methyl-5(b-hydroxyethyl)-thiazole monophosphate biosynthesis
MVYVLLAEGFEEIEAVYPIDVLRRCGAEVKIVGVTGTNVTGSNGITIKADMPLDGVDIKKITMLILPGGPGRANIAKDEKAMELVGHCCKSDSITVAAICGAPEILGGIGMLQGVKATCYPGLESKLVGAVLTDNPVVVDGNIITSQAAGTSEAFAFALAEKLVGKEKADEIRKKMLCS